MFQFENDEQERHRTYEERLKEKHYQSIEALHNKHQTARNELLAIQVSLNFHLRNESLLLLISATKIRTMCRI